MAQEGDERPDGVPVDRQRRQDRQWRQAHEPAHRALNLKDVFAGQGGDHHQNSGLTPEAIAQAKPQWVIVMDRDAAVEPEDGSKPQLASAVFAAQDAFKNTEFTTKNQIVYSTRVSTCVKASALRRELRHDRQDHGRPEVVLWSPRSTHHRRHPHRCRR
jgi:hypothetical protein